MTEKRGEFSKRNKRTRNYILLTIILVIIIGIPLLFLNYQAKRSGLSRREVVYRLTNRIGHSKEDSGLTATSPTGEKVDFLDPSPIGQGFTEPPLISHIQPVDLDDDRLTDILVCDAKQNFVSWIRQYPVGTYTEKIIAGDIIAPAHVQTVDFDFDGDKDLMIGVLGMLFPNNDKIGSVVILENNGLYEFTKHVITEKIARVSDVRAGDLDGDGDMDLAVAQFGYDDGETRWIENLGNWKFENHILQNLSGPINVEILDIDKDKDLDIIALVSQEWEEIYCYVNDGKGSFQSRLLFGSSNQDFGSSMLSVCDYDKDGDEDILYTNGDAFDYIPPQGRPWHGVNVLENKGDLVFEFRRLCYFTGATYMKPADIDNDGDIDFFAVATWNLWDRPESQSMIWLENIDNVQFTRHEITNNPTHLLCCEPGDFNNDGLTDVITCGMHTFPPYDRMGRITLWINNGALAFKNK
ncbi:MAG: repeat protein [Bacteroidetes bacterium]|nr:repeat protein [Bacteroidota bacterium]